MGSPRSSVDHRSPPLGGHPNRSLQVGLFMLGQEVQWIAKEGPALGTGSEEADIVERHSAAPRWTRQLPPQQPGWIDPSPRADDADVRPLRPREIASEFG